MSRCVLHCISRIHSTASSMDLSGTDRQWGRMASGRLAFALTFIAFLVPVWGYTATSSVTWMRMLDLESFQSAGDVWTYLINLRTGIPPVLSALELLWWVQFRDLTLFSGSSTRSP